MDEHTLRAWMLQGARGRFFFNEPATGQRMWVQYLDDRDCDGHYEVAAVDDPSNSQRFYAAESIIARYGVPHSMSQPTNSTGISVA